MIKVKNKKPVRKKYIVIAVITLLLGFAISYSSKYWSKPTHKFADDPSLRPGDCKGLACFHVNEYGFPIKFYIQGLEFDPYISAGGPQVDAAEDVLHIDSYIYNSLIWSAASFIVIQALLIAADATKKH